MKRTFLAVGVIALLASCGGPDKAAYDAAADKICDCMAKKEAEAANDDSEFSIDFTDVDYALCALEVATEVDPTAEEMGASIDEKCPDLSETHKNYVKSAH